MKKISSVFLALSLMLTTTTLVFSQDKSKGDRKENFEKIEAAKKDYFKQELKLTDEEAAKFWVVYDEFNKEQRELRKKQKELGRELKNGYDSIPEKEFKSKMESFLTLETQEVELKKKYLTRSAEVIGYKRAAHALQLEREFKRELMDKARGEKREGPHPGKSERGPKK